MRKLPCILLLLLTVLVTARAQSFDASKWSEGVTTIDAPWRFQTGDDPRWATPDFDDSSWPLLKTGQTWTDQGYRGYSGYAWYRLRLDLPAGTQPLGINVGHINSSAEIYADGQLIGTTGIMRPKPDWGTHAEANAYPLPLALNGHQVEFAVRVWKSPVATSYSGGGFISHPVVGSLPLIQSAHRVAIDNLLASYFSDFALDLLCLALGCFSLGLFILDRRYSEYAWFAFWAFGVVLIDILRVISRTTEGSVTFNIGLIPLLTFPFILAELLFLWGFLKARRDWMLLLAALFGLTGAVGYAIGFINIISLPICQLLLAAFTGLFFIVIIARVLLSLKNGNRNARLLIVPVCLMAVGDVTAGVRLAIYYAGLSKVRPTAGLVLWTNGITAVDWNDVFKIFYFISITVALLLRFTRSAQEERRLSTELESAREVQLRLVPAQLPILASGRLESAYLPATEVGGDFYQVLPQPRGATLIVIGDVSGKGLKAAMTGTLVLGALRALAQEDLSPSQILQRLNDQLAAFPDGGFITCLCARIMPNGAVTIANAGHLAPYSFGKEVPCDPGLPLGIAPNCKYPESSSYLAPGETLTFLSDGVVEARDSVGELYGFERASALSSRPAQEIAYAAQAFGQEDDITVLTFTRTPAPPSIEPELALLVPEADTVKP
jgi:phosphoserine phosphatase RsbU/P